MDENKRNKLGQIALKKARQLDKLIMKLKNTTIGSISEATNNNSRKIEAIEKNINNINSELLKIKTEVQSISSILGIEYNEDGTVLGEKYTTHTHNYKDVVITDTDDGSGVESETTKETDGISKN
jgi:hypothetical protein